MKNVTNTKTFRRVTSVGVVSIALLGSFLFSGCGPAFRTESCRASVLEAAETDDVVNVPGKDFSFIVRKPDGSVWIYKTMSVKSPEVTEKLMLFYPLPNAKGDSR